VNSRRVLWFINKVPLAVGRTAGIPSVRGGWLDSYIEIMAAVADIDLTVAFPDSTEHASSIRIGGVTFVGLPTGDTGSGLGGVIRRWRHNVAPPEVLTAAARLVREVDPALVHLHGADWTCYGLAVHDCGIPTVLSIQGSPTTILPLYLRGLDRHFLRSLSFEDFLKGRGPVHDYALMKARAANEAIIMASVNHIAGRTEWDRRLASIMAPQAVYHHCDEPMRLPFYQASWQADAAVPGRIVCIMSGDYLRKGVGTLLRAVGILRRAKPDIALVLAGFPPETESGRATMRHIRALGIESCVTVMGDIDAQAVASELIRASVFVSSSHCENGSNALSEAQLVGVPCVASCAGGMVTTADHGSAALLVQDGDAEALAGAVLSLINDPQAATALGQRGRALATTRHNRDCILAQILSIYDTALA